MLRDPVICDEYSFVGEDGNLKDVYHEIYGNLTQLFNLIISKVARENVKDYIDDYLLSYCRAYIDNDYEVRMRDDLEMLFCVITSLVGDTELSEKLVNKSTFEIKNSYGYYAGFKQSLLGMNIGNKKLKQEASVNLDKGNALKWQYFPSKPLIISALNGDGESLKKAVKRIPAKFRSYAKKQNAINKNGDIVFQRMHKSWATPIYDWAFILSAHRGACEIGYSHEIWFPKERLLEIFG